MGKPSSFAGVGVRINRLKNIAVTSGHKTYFLNMGRNRDAQTGKAKPLRTEAVDGARG